MFNTPTNPDTVRPHTKFWLAKNGDAFKVDDHLRAAQYAKDAIPNDDDDRMIWGYNQMFSRGFCRVHVENDVIWVDREVDGESLKPNLSQMKWLKTAQFYLNERTGKSVRISSGMGSKEVILSREDVSAIPTQKFLQIMEKENSMFNRLYKKLIHSLTK